MRPLILLGLLLGFCTCSNAVPTRVQSCGDSRAQIAGPTGAATCTLTGVGANHWLFLAVWFCGGGAVPSDTFGLTYTTATSVTGPVNCNLRISNTALLWVQTGAHSGNDTITVGMDGVSCIGVSIVFEEWTQPNFALSPPSDKDKTATATGSSGGAGTITTGNVTTTQAGELLLAVGRTMAGGTSLTAGSGYTIGFCQPVLDFGMGAPGGGSLCTEAKIGTVAGTEAGSFTQSGASPWAILFGTYFSGANPRVRHRAQVIRYRKPKKHKILLARNESDFLGLPYAGGSPQPYPL